MAKVEFGDSVYVKSGVYREAVVWDRADRRRKTARTTLSAYPGHRPVIKGSEIVPRPWTQMTGKPIYTCSWDDYAQLVFFGQTPLKQIGLQGSPERAEKGAGFRFKKQWDGKGVDDMRPGTFYYDKDKKQLHVWLPDGGDPGDYVVEAAVRSTGISTRGTWTVSGFDVRHVKDGCREHTAIGAQGIGVVVEACRITHNGLMGLIVVGADCVIRNCEIAYNGLCGLSCPNSVRMLVEGNECHHNSWRGDVVCLHHSNKITRWNDCRFLRNHFHHEMTGLWLDINVNNALVAENLFEDCQCGLYYEISRWGVLVNNVFRNCHRGLWSYSSDVLIAHNAFDQCSTGIVVTASPRHAWLSGTVRADRRDCAMAVRNNLVVNNIIVDSPGAYISVNEASAYGWGNYSDYNVFAWTLPAYHPSADHIKFASGWHRYYANLAFWRRERHYGEHSMIADPGVYQKVHEGFRYVYVGKQDVAEAVGIVDRERGDYRLAADSPLLRRGIGIPSILDSICTRAADDLTRPGAWAPTQLKGAPPGAKSLMKVWDADHYRIQPLPATHRLVDLDAQGPADPGLNVNWQRTGQYPAFGVDGDMARASTIDCMVYPENRLGDPSFDEKFVRSDAPAGQEPIGRWVVRGALHTSHGIGCANLLRGHQSDNVAFQRVCTIAPDTEHILIGDMRVTSRHESFESVGEMYLAVGSSLKPVGVKASVRAKARQERHWNTYDVRYRSTQDDAGQDLYVVVSARAVGPKDAKTSGPVGFVRWDNFVLLCGSREGE